jgi:hypothetical protein
MDKVMVVEVDVTDDNDPFADEEMCIEADLMFDPIENATNGNIVVRITGVSEDVKAWLVDNGYTDSGSYRVIG